jgi:NAD(P)-dependent dehydrogenase (short-subunit alcohol dehydrogenase family)
MRFQDKTAVITGAASGIGRAAALLFAAEGAKVYAADIDETGLAETIALSNGSVTAVRCDVCVCEEIKALMDRAAAETGGIDAVFNNAGAGGDQAPIDEIEPAGWDRTMDLLLRSVAFGIRYAAPHMKGRKGAAIVNTSSIAAVGPGYSPNAYAVAKAGVLHLTKTSAADLARYQIRVNAVQPGFINTNIFTRHFEMTGELETQAKGAIAMMSEAAQPVARGGMPNDIAEAVLYLCSDAASFVNGTSLIVDGGLTIGPRHSWDPEMPDMFSALREMKAAAEAQKPA